MNETSRRLAAALAIFLGAVALPAQADLFEFRWGYRWSIGSIAHDMAMPDSDPSTFRDVYVDGLRGYAFDAFSFDESRFLDFKGSGGTLVVEHLIRGDGGGPCDRDVPSLCYLIDSYTFLMGTTAAPVRLVATTPARVWDPGELPPFSWNLAAEWSLPLEGHVTSGRTSDPVLVMNEGAPTLHLRLATPVPEPGALGLLASGLVVIGAMRGGARRRRPWTPHEGGDA